MSWSERSRPRSRLASAALAAAMCLATAGCFRPLYGPTASGSSAQDLLATVEVEEIGTSNDRIAHFLRSELVYDLDGSGRPRPKAYKLGVSVTESVGAPIVETVTGRAQAAVNTVTANFSLKDANGTVLTSGRSVAVVSYDRTVQRFANVRAARDAEIRASKQLSEEIRTRLAIYFATRA
jgi:LPS-assembly lipoprotein